MASVCGGCLALMDAGVPIQVQSRDCDGFILEENGFSILSDILGVEDALGDMDFKVAGEKKASQLSKWISKLKGLRSISCAQRSLRRNKADCISCKMLDACPTARPQMSIYAPRIERMQCKTK